MKCQNCGSKILKNAIFCNQCGKNVDPKINKNSKNVKSKFNIFFKLAIVLLFILIVLIILEVFSLNRKKETKISPISLDYQYLAVTNTNEYIIYDADINIGFEVTAGTKFKILDENNNKIDAEIIDNKIVNPDGYQKGMKYTLSIDDGNFVSQQLKEINKVTFKIARDEVKKYKLKDDVIKVNNNDIQFIGEKLVIANSTYKIGDVLVIYDGDSIENAYVITNIDIQGNYDIIDANLDQIYSELDFYYEEYADLSKYDTYEQIEEYVIASAKNANWYDAIIETVHAAPKLKVELKNVENGIQAKVSVTIKAGDKSSLIQSNYHDFSFSYTHTLQVKTLFDITLTNWDASIQIMNQQDFNFKISNTEINYDAPMSKELIKKIQDAINNKTNTDSNNKELKLVMISIPTTIPGLTFEIEAGLVNKINLSVDFENNLSLSNVITVAFDYGVSEKFTPLSSYNYEILDSNMKASGNLGIESGIKLAAHLDFVGLLEGGIAASGGLYGKASISVTDSVIKNETKLNFNYALGLFVKLNLELEIANTEFKYSLIDKKYPLLQKNWEYSDLQMITFNTDGGSVINNQKVKLGNKVVKPDNPVKEGYTFDHWELDGNDYNFDTEVSSSFELKAIWTEKISEGINNNMDHLSGYGYNVVMTTKMDNMDLTINMNCKLDNVSKIEYCKTSTYGVTTEVYKDYANQMIYSKVSVSFGDDAISGQWYKNKFSTGTTNNNWVGLTDFMSTISKEKRNGGTYYKGKIDSKKLAEAMSQANPDIDSSSIISEDIDISFFVNSSNYLETIEFTMVIAGLEQNVVVNFKDFNTTGALKIPSDAR